MKRKIKTENLPKKEQNTAPRQAQTCSGSTPVPGNCMENAAFVLLFEKNQISNYLKQSKQLIRHNEQADNKLIKKGEFKESADHMMMAIGGNLSNPICGENSTDPDVWRRQQRDLNLHMDYYNKLNNCSAAIHEDVMFWTTCTRVGILRAS